MEKWKIIGRVKHKGDTYIIFINKKYTKFFMKISENGKLDYPTLTEYNELAAQYSFDSCLRINHGYKKHTFSIEPKIYVGKKLTSLALAASMIFGISGCSSPKDALTEFAENGVCLEQMEDDSSMYKMTGVDITKINRFNSLNINADHFSNKSFKTCVPGTFYKYYGVEKAGWNEVYNTLENANIPDKIKKIIYDGLKKLEKSNFNMDLTVLNYNLEKLTVKFVEKEALPLGVAGMFVADGSIVSINKTADLDDPATKLILLHEILGHGMTMAYAPENGGISCSLYDSYYTIDDNKLTGSGKLGMSIFEAIPDIISALASGTKLDCQEGGYEIEVYTLQAISASLNCEISDIANYGVDYLIKLMQENKIDDPYSYIMSIDTQFDFGYQSQVEGILDDSTCETLLVEYFSEWSEERLKDGYAKDELIDEAQTAILNAKNLIKCITMNDSKIILSGSSNMNAINPTNVANVVARNIEAQQKEQKISSHSLN